MKKLAEQRKFYNRYLKNKHAFTMAEILISLTIIGVIAAITLPALRGCVSEKTWNSQRKALYSRISQAVALMPALNGYDTLGNDVDTAAETFISSGLSQVLKINNICDNEHFKNCGIVSTIQKMDGTKYTIPTTLFLLYIRFAGIEWGSYSYSAYNTKAAAFETQNGESMIAYYNRNCITQNINENKKLMNSNTAFFPEASTCVNFIYDLNGSKGPNTVGKDIDFITVFNSSDSVVVAPMPSKAQNAKNNTNMNRQDALSI